MTVATSLVLTNAGVYTLGSPDGTHGAVAVRDDKVVRVGRVFGIGLLTGVETQVVDCDGRIALPGFIDVHTHLPMVGRPLAYADFSAAGSPTEAVKLLRGHTAEVESDDETSDEAGWMLDYSCDESAWNNPRYPTRDDLDAVPGLCPIVAFRRDVRTAGVSSIVLDESPWEADLIRDIAVSMATVDDHVAFERD